MTSRFLATLLVLLIGVCDRAVAQTQTRTLTRSRPPTQTRTPTQTPTATLPIATGTPIRIVVGEVAGSAGDVISLPVQLDTRGRKVRSVESEIRYDPGRFNLVRRGLDADCVAGRSSVDRLIAQILNPNGIRIVVEPVAAMATLADGGLYSCRFEIKPTAPAGERAVTLGPTRALDLMGLEILNERENGSITVSPDLAAVIHVGDTCAAPGSVVTVAVEIATMGRVVSETANELEWESEVFELIYEEGLPACRMNPLLPKLFGLAVRPDRDSLRAQIIDDFSDVPLPDGLLYECRFNVSRRVIPGEHLVVVRDAHSFSPGGSEILATTGAPGVIHVGGGCCLTDCNGDGAVRIDEVIRAVSIALDQTPLSACAAVDSNGDGEVAVNELVRAVNELLEGC